MPGSDVESDDFHDAVDAIDAGDLVKLQQLIESHPRLVCDRLENPDWLRAQVGGAIDGFFSRPYLLWFVTEDVVRTGRLSPNIAQIAGEIIETARRCKCNSLEEQLETTLRLVCWSGVAAKCGVQLELIDVLVDAGADPARNPVNALVNGHFAAAEHLLRRGATLTLGTALCLDRWDDVPQLFEAANAEERQFSFVLAALNGRARAVNWMIEAGCPINQPSADLYPHGTPLHHAVCSGSLDTVKALVAGGADINRPDSAWNGTPLGWALHYVEESTPEQMREYPSIAAFLQQLTV